MHLRFLALVVVFHVCTICDDSLQIALKLQKQTKEVIRKTISAYVSIGGGAGAIISSDGYIITNNHVVENVDHWSVTAGNGKIYKAEVVGRDKLGDLCLLKIATQQQRVPFLKLGNSDKLHQGQKVLAMGNPFLYSTDGSPSVSMGVISALHCFQDNYGDAIQTDTSLNPGNSGGPLINFKGELIGVCGRIASRFNDRRSSGVGFAISVNQIKNFLPILKQGKEIVHGRLNADVSEYFNQGVLIKSSPIKVLQPGDIILRIERFPVYSLDMLYGRLWIYPAFSTVDITVKRRDKIVTIPITLRGRR